MSSREFTDVAMPDRTIGIVANPASGKDVRRVTARASVFDNQEKSAMVRRCLVGIRAMGKAAIRYLPDAHHIVRRAVEETGIAAEPLALCVDSCAEDTERAAHALKGAAAVVVLGGDGTNRAFAKGWRDAPLISISTGTNNAFPAMLEATTAGAAAGLLAERGVPLRNVAAQAKVIHVAIDGEADDLALIDAVLTRERFVGARALDAPARFAAALLTQANPAGVGMTSIGGFVRPLAASEDAALALRFRADASRTVLAAVAPGRFERVGIESADVLDLDVPMDVVGPGVLAFDGERERPLRPGQRATLRVRRDGPWVIDVGKVLARSAFCNSPFQRTHRSDQQESKESRGN